jgi:hypothetical protein
VGFCSEAGVEDRDVSCVLPLPYCTASMISAVLVTIIAFLLYLVILELLDSVTFR